VNAIIDEINRLWPMLSVLLTVCGILATLFAGYFLYHLRRHFVSRSEHEAHCAEHDALADEHGRRLDALERHMETVPKKDDLLRLQLSIEELRGEYKALNAKMDGISDTLSIMQRSIELLVQSHMGE
jgi:hypothetical protein